MAKSSVEIIRTFGVDETSLEWAAADQRKELCSTWVRVWYVLSTWNHFELYDGQTLGPANARHRTDKFLISEQQTFHSTIRKSDLQNSTKRISLYE